MNFGDWQAQQRALKEEERRRKTQAAEALKNYRSGGLSEGETKLSAIKEEERKKKIEAESQLRKYRGSLSEEDARKALEKENEIRRKKEAEEQLRALGGKDEKKQGDDFFVSGAVSTKAQMFSHENEYGGAYTSISSPTKSMASANTLVLDDGGSVGMLTPPITPLQPVLEPSAHSIPIDTDVSFVFGLISEDESPSLEGYTAAINELVKEKLGQLSPAYRFEYPIVRNNEIDDMFKDPAGRPAVKRRMITVSIPFTAPDSEAAINVRMQIVGSIRRAIQNETLKKLNQ